VPGAEQELGDTIAWAHQHGIEVVVAGPNPEFDVPFPRVLMKAIYNGTPEDAIYPHFLSATERTDREMSQLSRTAWHVPYVSFFETYCVPRCPLYLAPHVPLLVDGTHLSRDGGDLFAAAVADRVRKLDASKPAP
jgi:lysophospholipase L1-like esterase